MAWEKSSLQKTGLAFILLALATSFVYRQVTSFSFVGFDDPNIVSENRLVKNGLTAEGAGWAFFRSWRENVYFRPVPLVTHMLDCELFGENAGMHHLSNLICHLATIILVFLFLFKISDAPWRSALAAGVFSLHPVNADSVAWVAQRSNLLCALFFMAALVAYISYCNTQIPKRGKALFLFSLFLSALSLLSKPTAAVLPFVMLLSDWLVTGRFGAFRRKNLFLFYEKLPFAILAGAWAFASLAVAKASSTAPPVPMFLRLENFLVSCVIHIRRLFLPYDLSVYYPFPEAIAWWKPLASIFLLVLVTAAAFLLRRKRPLVLFGWLWFLVTLLPVSGLVQAGPWPAMADHFAYLPMVGLLAAVVWSVPESLWSTKKRQKAFFLCCAALLVATGACCHRQAGYYRNDITLFTRALELDGQNFLAITALGNAWQRAGDLQRAEALFRRAVRLRPESAGAHNNLGALLARQGRDDEAALHLETAVKIDPSFATAHVNLGNLFLKKGMAKEAQKQYRLALLYDPELVSAQNNLALALAASGQKAEAMEMLRKALEKRPEEQALKKTLKALLDEKE